MGDEVGGLSTWLGLIASPPLILSTESVVVMERKVLKLVLPPLGGSSSRDGYLVCSCLLVFLSDLLRSLRALYLER